MLLQTRLCSGSNATKLIRQCLTVQTDNKTKHAAKATQYFSALKATAVAIWDYISKTELKLN